MVLMLVAPLAGVFGCATAGMKKLSGNVTANTLECPRRDVKVTRVGSCPFTGHSKTVVFDGRGCGRAVRVMCNYNSRTTTTPATRGGLLVETHRGTFCDGFTSVHGATVDPELRRTGLELHSSRSGVVVPEHSIPGLLLREGMLEGTVVEGDLVEVKAALERLECGLLLETPECPPDELDREVVYRDLTDLMVLPALGVARLSVDVSDLVARAHTVFKIAGERFAKEYPGPFLIGQLEEPAQTHAYQASSIMDIVRKGLRYFESPDYCF